MPAERIIFEATTQFETYTVVERTYEGRPARVLFSGANRAAQSGIALDDNPDLLFDYNQRMLELANAVYPKRVLVIGGGAYTLPMALTTALPDAVIDVVELDPALEQLSRDYFGLRTNDRLHLYSGDGRAFVEQSKDQYDLILIDVFSELQIPTPFLTIEFIQAVYKLVVTNGCVGVNIIASYQGRNVGYIKSQIAAYQQMFKRVAIFPAAHGLTTWLPQNLLLVAEKGTPHDLVPYVRYAPLDILDTVPSDIRRD